MTIQTKPNWPLFIFWLAIFFGCDWGLYSLYKFATVVLPH